MSEKTTTSISVDEELLEKTREKLNETHPDRNFSDHVERLMRVWLGQADDGHDDIEDHLEAVQDNASSLQESIEYIETFHQE